MQRASDAATAQTFITVYPFVSTEVLYFTTDRRFSEGGADGEPELERALRLQGVVQHAGPLRVIGEDQPERHVQHRHEEADLDAGRRLEVPPVEALARHQGRGE